MNTATKFIATVLALVISITAMIAIGTVKGGKTNAPAVVFDDVPWTQSPTAAVNAVTQAPTAAEVLPTVPVQTTTGVVAATTAQAPAQQQTQPAADYASMSKAQILQTLADAVNKTKAYTGALSVHHSETFDINVTKCTGGDMVVKVANNLVGSIMKPSDETLNFQNGTAVNSEGENVTILLPQKGQFRMTEKDITNATITKDGDNTVIEMTLVAESVGATDTPTANSAGVGYLDISNLDVSMLTINSAKIDYTGSTIKAVIAPNGYVVSATYTIPMHVDIDAKVSLINANAVFDGKEIEVWEFNW